MMTEPITMPVPLWCDEHGKPRIGETRVLLELVIYAFNQGETPESIVDSYPTLALADVYSVLGYYLSHRVEVDDYVRQADEAAERIQRETEADYSPETLALKARLRAFRDNKQRPA